MKKVLRITLTAVLVGTFATIATGEGAVDSVDLQRMIQARNERFTEHFHSSEVSELVEEFYTPSAILLLRPNAGSIQGHEELKREWRDWVDGSRIQIEPRSFDASCETAVEQGIYRLSNADSIQVLSTWDYTTVWQKTTGGTWKVSFHAMSRSYRWKG